MEAIEAEKARGIPDREWQIEYMLNYIPEEDQIIKEEWLRYEDENTFRSFTKRYSMSAVDPAVTTKSTSDYTAIVSGEVYNDKNTSVLKILPFPINRKMEAPEIIETIVQQSLLLGNGSPTKVCVESVAAQKYLIQMLRNTYQLYVEEFSPEGEDKRARLMTVSQLIKSGRVIFPKKGCEILISQMLNLGHGEHDDLCDALVMLIITVFKQEDGPRTICPRPTPEKPKPTQKELEREADQKQILEQEIPRGGYSDPKAFYKQKELEAKKRTEEAWREKGLKLLRDRTRRYRGY
jgi:predicted phage terminase large subunit-like protein